MEADNTWQHGCTLSVDVLRCARGHYVLCPSPEHG